jgi:hypothetical protein
MRKRRDDGGVDANQGIGDRRKAVFNKRTNIMLYERPHVVPGST